MYIGFSCTVRDDKGYGTIIGLPKGRSYSNPGMRLMRLCCRRNLTKKEESGLHRQLDCKSNYAIHLPTRRGTRSFFPRPVVAKRNLRPEKKVFAASYLTIQPRAQEEPQAQEEISETFRKDSNQTNQLLTKLQTTRKLFQSRNCSEAHGVLELYGKGDSD